MAPTLEDPRGVAHPPGRWQRSKANSALGAPGAPTEANAG